MLAIPLMKGSSVDFTNILYNSLEGQCDDKQQLLSDIQTVHRLRESAINVFECSDGALSLLRRCVRLLARLATVLSSSTDSNSNSNSNNSLSPSLSLPWADCLCARQTELRALGPDCAALAWNYGALLSLRASHSERASDDGLARACRDFMASAGAFLHAKTLLGTPSSSTFFSTSSSSLSPEGVQWAADLVLAQAQLCFYERAVREKRAGKMRAGIVSKVAAQCALMFEGARAQVPAGADPSWRAHLGFHCASMRAAAEYWQAECASETARAGGTGAAEAVARLARAEEVLAALMQDGARASETMRASAQALLRTVNCAREAAEKDNRSVYMERAVADAQLSRISPVCMVKPLPFDENSESKEGKEGKEGKEENEQKEKEEKEDAELFKGILPTGVRMARAEIVRALESLASLESSRAQSASSAARAALSALGLPGSIEAARAGEGDSARVPPALLAKIESVNGKGGRAELAGQLGALDNSLARALHALAQAQESVQREEVADRAFRARFIGFMGLSSESLLLDVKANLAQLRETLAKAQENDTAIKTDFVDEKFLSTLNTFAMPAEHINRLIFSPPLVTAPPQNLSTVADLLDFDHLPQSNERKNTVDTSVLEAKLVEMASLIDSREKALAQIQVLATTDVSKDLLAKFTSKNSINSEEEVRIVVSKADVFVQQIQQSINRQNQLLTEIQVANEEFVRANMNDPVSIQRNNVIQQFEQTINRLSSLQQMCDDLVFTQKLQRQEFEHNQSQEASRVEQERLDREFAERLALEMQQPVKPNPVPTIQQNYPAVPNFTPHHQPQVQTQLYGIPQQQTQQYQQTQQNQFNIPQQHQQLTSQPYLPGGGISPYDVSYGNPVSGPPQNLQQFNVPQQTQQPQYSQQYQSLPQQQYQAPSQNYQHFQQGSGYTYNQSQPQPQAQQQSSYPQPAQNSLYSQPAQNSHNLQPQFNQSSPISQPHQQQPNFAGGLGNDDFHSKALKLVEMGFAYNQCIEALQTSKGDENAALNILLGVPSNQSPVNATPAITTAAPAKSSGLFGVKWGRK